nr:spidroin-2 [Helicoverpa armigera]
MCDCFEEKQRKEREKARRAAAGYGQGGGGYGPGGGGGYGPGGVGGYGPGGGGGYGPGGGGIGPDGGYYGPDGTWQQAVRGPDGTWQQAGQPNNIWQPARQRPDGTWEPAGFRPATPESSEPPPSRFSALQMALGSTGFLLAMLALLLKVLKSVQNEKANYILSSVGLGSFVTPPSNDLLAPDGSPIRRNRNGAPCIPKKRVLRVTSPKPPPFRECKCKCKPQQEE